MIALPRPWLLTSAMLVGTAVGMVVGIASMLLVTAHIRPEAVVALVVGIPSAVGLLLLILFSGRRWVTAVGVFILALAPGWFGVLAAIQAVCGA